MNSKATVLKFVGGLFIIIGLLSGLGLYINGGAETIYSVVIIIASACVTGLLFISFGEVINLLQQQADNQNQFFSHMSKQIMFLNTTENIQNSQVLYKRQNCCIRCGATLVGDEKFCVVCGYKSIDSSVKNNLPVDEWVCTCGRKNKNYVSSCVCGVNKRDLKVQNL